MVSARVPIRLPTLEYLENSEDVKAFSGRRALHRVTPGWSPQKTSFNHQYWGLAALLAHERYIIWGDTGLGKTKIGLDAMDYYFKYKGLQRALVLTGKPTATFEWEDQSNEYVGYEVQAVQGDVDHRREQLYQFARGHIMATDYQTLQAAFTMRVKKGKGTKMVPDFEALINFGRQFGLVIQDELHRSKNRTSLRHHIVSALVQDIPTRWGFTGTMFARHPEDIWGEFHVVDDDATMGDWNSFSRYFFNERPSWYSPYVKELALKKELKLAFAQRMRHRVLRIESKECPDVPTMNAVTIRLRPPPGSMELIAEANRRVMAARIREEQHTEFQYLRQLASGLMRIREGDLNTTIRLEASTKIQWIEEWLADLPENEQVIIFYEFRESGAWVSEALRAMKQKVSFLYGGMPLSGAKEIAEWKAKKTRILLAQTEMAAESLNLQQSAFLVQYECPIDAIKEKQSLARCCGRLGGRPTMVYRLTVRGSIETRVLELLREGRELPAALFETQVT